MVVSGDGLASSQQKVSVVQRGGATAGTPSNDGGQAAEPKEDS